MTDTPQDRVLPSDCTSDTVPVLSVTAGAGGATMGTECPDGGVTVTGVGEGAATGVTTGAGVGAATAATGAGTGATFGSGGGGGLVPVTRLSVSRVA